MKVKAVNGRFVDIAVAMCLTLGTAAPVVGQAPGPSLSTWAAPVNQAEAGPRRFERNLVGSFFGQKVMYKAALEELIVKDRTGRPASSVFTLSFQAAPKRGGALRPVIFVFNGGPGAASNTLLFGALGPKRLTSFTSEAQANPKIQYRDNSDTVLDVADLVFIDPPETGYGRPLPDTDPKTFRSNDGDSFAVAQVIQRWLTENGRLTSKVYIAGESYGSLRAVMLARDLKAGSPGIDVSGLVLISQAIHYNGPATFGIRKLPDPMRAITRLHDVTALAWYHGLIDNQHQTLGEAVAAARQFAQTRYAEALLQGNHLPDAERQAVAAELERHTGLPAAYFLAYDLRIAAPRMELLASRGLALGQFDGRETEPLSGLVADANRDWDKASLGLTRAMERYVGETFHAEGLPAYRSIVPDPYGFEDTWTYILPPGTGLDMVLEEQLRANPKLRVMVTQGVFDTTSSMGATEFQFAQMPSAPGRVAIAYYPGGHMLYSDEDGLRAFTNDVRSFETQGAPVARPFPSPRPGTVK